MAIKSMTGFGRGEASEGAVKVVVELSAVNRKQFDLSLALPRDLAVLEPRASAFPCPALRDGPERCCPGSPAF